MSAVAADPSEPTLRESEIRPAELMHGQAERFAADIRRLLKSRAEFVDVGCPACASRARRDAFRKCEMSYVTCESCQTLYVTPRPPPSVLEQYYATSENYAYWNKYVFPASEDSRRDKIMRPRAERLAEICLRYGVPSRTVLEIGCGFGTFCQELKRTGLFGRIIGIEPTPDLARTCRARGIEVVEAPFERAVLPSGTIDVIASFEVIEHLFSPRSFIDRCRDLLCPGGILVVTCPNSRGFDIQVLQAKSDTVDVEHLNYFHPESLARLVSECSFSVLEVSTPGKLDAELVRKKVLAGEVDLENQPFLRQVLIERWDDLGAEFQKFLAEHRLSSHMWLVARRDAQSGR